MWPCLNIHISSNVILAITSGSRMQRPDGGIWTDVYRDGSSGCPVSDTQPECKVIGSEKGTKCCIASGKECASVAKNGEKQCCDPDEACIFKGSLAFRICGRPSGEQKCLQLGESCAKRNETCCSTFKLDTACAEAEAGGTKSLRCCVPRGSQCDPFFGARDQCCDRSRACKKGIRRASVCM